MASLRAGGIVSKAKLLSCKRRVHGVPPYEGGGFILLSGSCFVLGWIDGGVSGAVGFISIYL